MHNKKFLTGILSLMLVFGLFFFVGCPADDDGGGSSGGPAMVNAFAITLTASAGAAQPTAINHAQYSGVVTWAPMAATFVANTAYTATITLTAQNGWTFDGVAAGVFSVPGMTMVTPNPANSGNFAVTVTPTAAAAANPLVGSWRTGAANNTVNDLYVFTNTVAYYTIGNGMDPAGTINVDTGKIPIVPAVGGASQNYDYAVTGSNLVIQGSYVLDPTTNAPTDITLTRAEGTTGTAPYGIWYRVQGAETDSILLVIRQSGEVYSCIGTTEWTRRSYTLTGTAATPLIQWTGGATTTYSIDPDDNRNVTIGGTAYTKVTLP
ncbi:MAG: hypothetical protein LBT13_01905 [Treponema sp.]|jgi:hypothetical protein|nr:hypothetical protein [Treponema sp.]